MKNIFIHSTGDENIAHALRGLAKAPKSTGRSRKCSNLNVSSKAAAIGLMEKHPKPVMPV